METTLEEWKTRLQIVDMFIQILNDLTDPRKESALEIYRLQRDVIEAKIKELQPHDTVVQLKTVQLFGEAQR